MFLLINQTQHAFYMLNRYIIPTEQSQVSEINGGIDLTTVHQKPCAGVEKSAPLTVSS